MARELLGLLALAPRTVAELQGRFDLDAQQMAGALEILRKRGLARVTEVERARLYHFDDRAFRVIGQWMDEVARA
jgi:hypothetical protein